MSKVNRLSIATAAMITSPRSSGDPSREYVPLSSPACDRTLPFLERGRSGRDIRESSEQGCIEGRKGQLFPGGKFDEQCVVNCDTCLVGPH